MNGTPKEKMVIAFANFTLLRLISSDSSKYESLSNKVWFYINSKKSNDDTQ